MLLYYIYPASAILIALGYMLFDVFNRREVPNLFAYLTLIFAFLVLLLTGDWHLVLQSYLIAFIILGFGYVVYRAGELGLGDVFEFAALALLLAPVAVPLFAAATPTFSLPPIVSLFLDTGIAAITVVPIFYILMAFKRFGTSMKKWISRKDVLKAAVIMAAYLIFFALLVQISNAKLLLFSVLFFVLLGSALLLVFQRPMTELMVDRVSVSGFVEDDIIAFNLMSDKEIASAKRQIPSFDRLVTKKMVTDMKKKGIKAKFPVYKRAIPFAVPIFIGTVLTVLVGNILLFALFG